MKTIFIIMGIVLTLLMCENIRELRTFQITYYSVVSDKLAGLMGEHKILFLSDLHNRAYGYKNSRLLEAVRAEKPSVILIGGDMLVGKNGHDYRPAADFVKELPAVCPVYYANGNHEQRMKENPEKYKQSYFAYKKELEAAGVHFLENRTESVQIENVKVQITGLEIPKRGYRRIRKKKLDAADMKACIGTCEKKFLQILLAHNPSYMDAYLSWGADLILSGHLHGGIVRIPGLGGIISPGFELFPRYSGGCYREAGQTVVVSRGMGNHTIPVRLFNTAEIVALKLKGCETERNLV